MSLAEKVFSTTSPPGVPTLQTYSIDPRAAASPQPISPGPALARRLAAIPCKGQLCNDLKPSGGVDELVAQSVNRQDVPRLGAAVADLGSELGDVGVDSASRGIALVSPHVLEELLARNGLPFALDEVAQQLEL